MKLEFIHSYAVELTQLLHPCCKQIVIAGSICRKKPDDIKDIEIVCIPDKWKLEEFFIRQKSSNPYTFNFTKNGSAYKQFTWKSQKVDLFICKPDNFGWIYLMRTGSAEFNAWYLSLYRKKHGITGDKKASDGGYLRDAFSKKIITPDETAVFDLIDRPFVEPENRNFNHG